MVLFSIQFSALDYFIFSVYTNLNFNRMYSSTFQIFLQIFNKNILQSDILTAFFQHLLSFFEEMELMFVIHNISITTDDDITQFGDDINICPIYLSRANTIWGNCLNWLENTIVSDNICFL